MPYANPPPLDWGAQRLKDRVVFVTGASSGIGAAAVRRFAEEGAKVVAAARRADKLTQLADDLRAEGLSVAALTCDVTDEDSVKAAIDAVVEAYGRLDGAFNNAGVGGSRGPTTELSADTWDRV